MRDNARGLVDLGFKDLGYNYVTTDCGWPTRDRTADGQITWNTTLFPSGFPALGDYIHSLGLKFGIYSGAGTWECDTVNGDSHLQASLGHEAADAATFAAWGGDSLKYDNCWANVTEGFVDYTPSEIDPSVRFQAMATQLQAQNRSFIYDICQWGVGTDLGRWVPAVGGDTWRISNDIQNNWASIWRIVNEAIPYAKYTGPGRFIDMDMLTIGLGSRTKLTENEERFEMTMWAIEKSPLVIGAPMNKSLTPASSLAILGNEEVIAINQDKLAQQAKLIRRYTEEEYDIFAGALAGEKMVVAIPNWSNSSKSVDFDLAVIGVKTADARDVWAAKDLGKINGTTALSLAGHEAKLLVLSSIEKTHKLHTRSTYYAASHGTLANNATLIDCTSACVPYRWNNCTNACAPTKAKVALSVGASITFSNVAAGRKGGKKLVGVDYINYDVALQSAWTNGTNTRNLTLSVNGGTPKRWAFPISGGDWYETGRLNVEVDGFKAGSGNTVQVAAPGIDPGADLVGIQVYQ